MPINQKFFNFLLYQFKFQISSSPAVHFYEQYGKPMALKFVYNEESLKETVVCINNFNQKRLRDTNNQNPLEENFVY